MVMMTRAAAQARILQDYPVQVAALAELAVPALLRLGYSALEQARVLGTAAERASLLEALCALEAQLARSEVAG